MIKFFWFKMNGKRCLSIIGLFHHRFQLPGGIK